MHNDAIDIRKGLSKAKFTMDIRYTLNRFDWAKDAMHQAVEEALEAAADTAVRSAKRRAPRDTGELRASIDRTPVEKGWRGKYEVTIYADAEHARYVEFGGAHAPAQSFIRPAARAGKKKVIREIKKRAPGA